MKKRFVMFGLLINLFSCKSSSDSVRSFIPGEYVRFFEHEMRKEHDTIKIVALSDATLTYKVLKSMSFQKRLDGQPFPWQSKKESWVAIYDEKKQVLNVVEKGKVISFVPERGILYVGSTEYKKVK